MFYIILPFIVSVFLLHVLLLIHVQAVVKVQF